ncbi:MAG TPA: dihydrodipicolinate synthase family protein [Stellaceae bacterium]|jgi:4-hydroxy-tetrahydrodipicolinate synthase|nr:dihydrodipicolinate synthase family protein [Stellaceae bacterium]
MPSPQQFAGVLVPVLTPFTPSGEPDAGRFISFCRFLLGQGADGLAIFGTTSEANSMSGAERMALLDKLIAAGIPASRLMPGAGACSITEATTLIKHAVGHGVGGVLMLPPFYYKGMTEQGVYDFIAAVIDRVASPALRMYLYHIPPQTMIPIGIELVGKLIKAYPTTVVGLKDSSGDWSNTEALCKAYSAEGFAIFPGSEVFLLDGLRAGGVGCITASGNVNVPGIRKVYENWKTPQADQLQADITRVRMTIQKYPMVPALKRIVAHFHNDPDWAAVRPPMERLSDAQSKALLSDLAAIGYSLGDARREAAE